MIETASLTLRNQPIISNEVQNLLADKRILFAGCGLGSCIAESLTRLGASHFVLIDNDTIETHNLNRQSFDNADIGTLKVEALKKRILAINPRVSITCHPILLDFKNTKEIVSSCDIIIDTIDFLDLGAIISLHDEALAQKKPVISLFTAGWGAVGMFIPPEKEGPCWARQIFNVRDAQKDKLSYTYSFIEFFKKIGPQLNPKVSLMMNEVFQKMLDNKPCPAPTVIAGAQSAALIAEKLVVDFLEKNIKTRAPDFIYLDLESIFSRSTLKVSF